MNLNLTAKPSFNAERRGWRLEEFFNMLLPVIFSLRSLRLCNLCTSALNQYLLSFIDLFEAII